MAARFPRLRNGCEPALFSLLALETQPSVFEPTADTQGSAGGIAVPRRRPQYEPHLPPSILGVDEVSVQFEAGLKSALACKNLSSTLYLQIT